MIISYPRFGRYVTQNFPPPPNCLRQINTTISWFIWRGKCSESLSPPSSVEKLKGDGTWLMHGPRIERYSFTAYKRRASELDPSMLDGWGFGT